MGSTEALWSLLEPWRLAPRVAGALKDPNNYSRAIELPHPDPADRFLAATALVYGLTLVTADTRLLRLTAISTLPNQ